MMSNTIKADSAKKGTKHEQLCLMENLGISVPKFIGLSSLEIQYCDTDQLLTDLIERRFTEKYHESLPEKVSVRSSGNYSMPGMMKTYLNVSKENISQKVGKVCRSANSSKVKNYLEIKKINNFQFGVIIQQMVYGNQSENSCSGVLITVNPYDEKSDYYAEIVFNSFGDDLMNGVKTPENLTELKTVNPIGFESLMQQIDLAKKDSLSDEALEIEFVISDQTAYILQRRAFHSPGLAFISPSDRFDSRIGSGRPVNMRGATGKVTYDQSRVKTDSILIKETTDFEDIADLLTVRGLITLSGGRLSHAAITATEFNIPCVVGASFKQMPAEGQQIVFTAEGLIFNA